MNTHYAILNPYQDFTDTTAIFPKEQALSYTALGFVDEIGELFEKVEAYVTRLPGLTTTEGMILAEVGDVLWYAAQLLRAMGKTFADLDAIDCQPAEHEATLLGAAGMAVRRGAFVAGRVKKSIRDGHLQTDKTLSAICDVLAALYEVTRFFRSNLVLAAVDNESKLRSRQERGVLKGDGDQR